MTPEASAAQIANWLKDKQLSLPMLESAFELAITAAVLNERRRVRKILTRRLDLSRHQRAYSWHEIQEALEAIEKPAESITE